MANKKNKYSILAVLLIMGMAVVGCDSGSGSDDEVDASLNGTWELIECIDDEGEDCLEEESYMKLDSGNLEASFSELPAFKGTYSTKDDKATLKPTHIHGGYFQFMLDYMFEEEGLPSMKFFDSKWYTKTELKSQIESKFEEYISYLIKITVEEKKLNAEQEAQLRTQLEPELEELFDEMDEDLGKYIDELFSPQTDTYSITDNKLVFTGDDGDKEVYIKK